LRALVTDAEDAICGMERGERQSVVVERVVRACGVRMIEITLAGWMGDGIRVL
jgi:hypothetical protein